MARRISVRLLVGLGEDDTLPMVAGCMDENLWEIVSPEESDASFAKMKAPFEVGGYSYLWREVVISLDADELAPYFAAPRVEATIEGAS